ncbi:homocysteine S-methyltransferase family protein [Shimia thalassica]|uniref:homocysteine S-methyltransferase family protein n=1 Tax=Shimia thalassica TaxID=1715693 RepID=UPI003F61B05A
MIAVGKATGSGVVLESPTWVANRDRGAELGYTPEHLADLNKQAVKLMSDVRETMGDLPTVLSANIGPRDDAYAPTDQMTADEAEAYHLEQVAALADTDVDLISGYTVAYPAEAMRSWTMPRSLTTVIRLNWDNNSQNSEEGFHRSTSLVGAVGRTCGTCLRLQRQSDLIDPIWAYCRHSPRNGPMAAMR